MNVRRLGFCLCLTTSLPWLMIQSLKAEEFPLSDPTPTNAESIATPSQIQSIARAITVKVLVGNFWGSGIIVRRQNNIYTVLTNAHVAALGESYRIQTPDGRIYSARVQATDDLEGEDLAALSFTSSNSYQVATLAIPSGYNRDSLVFAAGFPAKSQFYSRPGLTITNGKISTLLERSMKGGYQLGYTNDIYKGMSGGPLLNELGEVIAVNGKHKFPLWGNTYFFKDGSTPDEISRRSMDYLSWGIPMSSVSQKLPQLIHPKTSQLPRSGALRSPQTLEDEALGFSIPRKARTPEPDLSEMSKDSEDLLTVSENDRRRLFKPRSQRYNRQNLSETRSRKAW